MAVQLKNEAVAFNRTARRILKQFPALGAVYCDRTTP